MDDVPPAVSDPETKASATPDSEPMMYCPVCNQHLEPHKCKLVCTRCGYYMSCADYY